MDAKEAISRAMCASSPQALNSITFNSRGKRRYETVQEYVDAHWMIFWPSQAVIALDALKAEAERRVMEVRISPDVPAFDACVRAEMLDLINQ